MKPKKNKRAEWQLSRERFHISAPFPPRPRRPEKRIGAILAEIQGEKSDVNTPPVALEARWGVIAGEQIAQHTHPAYLRGTQLVVYADHPGWLAEIRRLLPLPVAVGLVAERAAIVAVDPHRAVAMVAVDRAAGRIDRDQVVVHAGLSSNPALSICSLAESEKGTMYFDSIPRLNGNIQLRVFLDFLRVECRHPTVSRNRHLCFIGILGVPTGRRNGLQQGDATIQYIFLRPLYFAFYIVDLRMSLNVDGDLPFTSG